MEATTTSYGAREWAAVEAALGVVGLVATAALRSEEANCQGSSGGCSLGPSLWQVVTFPVFVGGTTAAVVDFGKGNTRRSEEIETHASRRSFECRRPAEAGVLVSLVFPGGPALSGYTGQDGRATFDLGDRRALPELWVRGKPLRLVSIPARQP